MHKMSKVKVLFVTNLYPSDTEPDRGVYIRNQAEALNKVGYKVCILLMDYRSIKHRRKWGIYWRKQENIWVCHFSVPMSPWTTLKYVFARVLTEYGIKCVEKRFGKPDIIHGHFVEGSYGLIGIKRKCSIPIVFTEHGSNLLKKNRSKSENERMRRLYTTVDEMIVVGHQQYICAEEFEIKSLSVIPNVIPAYFKYIPKKDNENKDLSFIAVGNLIESKCFGLLIDAIGNIHSENIKLTIVGKGPLERELKKKVLKKDLSNYISFTGAIQNAELVRLYNSADCFVLPSRFETFGVVYAEALCTGTPIISTKNGGIDDIYEDGCGFLIEIDNEEELREAMKKFASVKFDHQALADKYQNKFGEKNFICKIEEVYERALKGV